MTNIQTLDTITTRLNAHDTLGQLGGGEQRAIVALAAARERGEQISLGDLARRVGMSRAAITSLADRIEANELLTRHTWIGDRRRTEVRITDSGYAQLAEAVA